METQGWSEEKIEMTKKCLYIHQYMSSSFFHVVKLVTGLIEKIYKRLRMKNHRKRT